MSETVPPLSIIELDQLDIYGRIQNDPYFVSGVPVLLELKGITENDVTQAIETANQSSGKVGSVVIVLMPTLEPNDRDAPGPRYVTVYNIQVIDYPLYRRQAVGGTQCSADEIADRLRQILHRFTMGRGQTIVFKGQRPLPIAEGKVSYNVGFARIGNDQPPIACASPLISYSRGTGLCTLTCATAGAKIYYTVDGSYPGSLFVSPAGTATLYTVPFTAPPLGSTVRAAAEFTAANYQQSQAISNLTFIGNAQNPTGMNYVITP